MLPSGYPTALALTLAVEVPLYAAALRAGWRVPLPRAVLAAVAVNLLTHPALWYALAPLRDGRGYPLVVVVAEIVACALEWALLALVARGDRAALAAVCVAVNAASVAAGLLVLPR